MRDPRDEVDACGDQPQAKDHIDRQNPLFGPGVFGQSVPAPRVSANPNAVRGENRKRTEQLCPYRCGDCHEERRDTESLPSPCATLLADLKNAGDRKSVV